MAMMTMACSSQVSDVPLKGHNGVEYRMKVGRKESVGQLEVDPPRPYVQLYEFSSGFAAIALLVLLLHRTLPGAKGRPSRRA